MKQLLDDGLVTKKWMLVKDRRSAGWSFSEPDQEEKTQQTKLNPTRDCSIQMRDKFEPCTEEDQQE